MLVQIRAASVRLRFTLASVDLVRSDLWHMTNKLEAKYAQMVKDADCPEGFVDWMKKQNLTNIESFGRAAPTEEKLATEVTDVAKSDGAKFDTLGDKACVAKLRAACRDALESGSFGGLARVAPNLEQGLGEGTEHTIKELWLTRHAWALSDSLLLVRPCQANLHRELTAASPVLGVYAMEQLRTMGLPRDRPRLSSRSSLARRSKESRSPPIRCPGTGRST